MRFAARPGRIPRRVVSLLVASLLLLMPTPGMPNNLPSVEDFRGALFVCSGGTVTSSGVSAEAGVDAFISMIRRGIRADLDAGGSLSQEDIGKVFQQAFAEGERFQVYQLYTDCLENFISPLVLGENGSGPGLQVTSDFTTVVFEAYEIDDIAVITLGISGFKESRNLGIVTGSFRGLTSSGGIYTLADMAGLQECADHKGNRRDCGVPVNVGDNLTVLLTFEKIGGRVGRPEEQKTFSFSGNVVFRGEDENLGLRQIPLVALN
ncbi:MAG: hypothetical protein AAGG56_12265 [Pseudomonadota bacterium]